MDIKFTEQPKLAIGLISALVVALPQQVLAQEEAIEEIVRNFQRVHFAFDSTDLVDDSEVALGANAKIFGAPAFCSRSPMP